MNEPLYQIGSITAGAKFDNFGRVVRTKLIKYMVGGDGPFTLEVLPADDTAERIQSLLQAEAGKIIAIRAGA